MLVRSAWADLFQWQLDKSQYVLIRPGEQAGGSGNLPLLPALTDAAIVQAHTRPPLPLSWATVTR